MWLKVQGHIIYEKLEHSGDTEGLLYGSAIKDALGLDYDLEESQTRYSRKYDQFAFGYVISQLPLFGLFAKAS